MIPAIQFWNESNGREDEDDVGMLFNRSSRFLAQQQHKMSKQSRRVQIVGLQKPNDCFASSSPLVYIGFYWFALVYVGLQKPNAGCEATLIITVLQ